LPRPPERRASTSNVNETACDSIIEKGGGKTRTIKKISSPGGGPGCFQAALFHARLNAADRTGVEAALSSRHNATDEHAAT
jgi:hypothetical protein